MKVIKISKGEALTGVLMAAVVLFSAITYLVFKPEIDHAFTQHIITNSCVQEETHLLEDSLCDLTVNVDPVELHETAAP